MRTGSNHDFKSIVHRRESRFAFPSRLAAKIVLVACTFATLTGAACAADWYRFRGPDLNGISKETGWQVNWPADGPKQLWKASIGTGFSSLAVSKGHVYAMGNKDDKDTVYCFAANSGAVVWKHTYDCPLDPKYYEGGSSSTPTVDGDQVYTMSKKVTSIVWMPTRVLLFGPPM